ncbi:hypothetical protein ACIQAD_22340 [Streptomyces sp. NPDC088551]|uniref:hypothetical protein n=1 Tax=Streptomyces sp. NPDC088551 TaxID=3365863 RepID=UPI00381DD40E
MKTLWRRAAPVLAVSGIGAFVVGVGSAVSGAGPSGLVWLGVLGGVLLMVMSGVTTDAEPTEPTEPTGATGPAGPAAGADAGQSGHNWWADDSAVAHASGAKEPEPKGRSGTDSGGCGGDGGGCGGCGGCGG